MACELLVMGNESKFHTKMIVTHMRSKGIEIFDGSGKKPWNLKQKKTVNHQKAMIACQKTDFAETFQDSMFLSFLSLQKN